MSLVKGRNNLATEVRLSRIFRQHGIVGWRRQLKIFGKPDFVFPGPQLAVFVDGCFWHGCRLHRTIPENNRLFWKNKIEQNKKRDRIVKRELKIKKWGVLRIWQHELDEPEKIAKKVLRKIGSLSY